MSLHQIRGRRPALLLTVTGLALSSALILPGAAQAAPRDRDGDGMPNRWESNHGLNPDRADGRGDKDDDALRNLAEFRRGGHPGDEDTDNDGHDDGDEVYDDSRSTDLEDRDSDDDGKRDGDEDSDDDGTDNEDEDDAVESCDDDSDHSDDDDRDADDVSDEDENDYGFRVGDDDSDDDLVPDGEEDSDKDGRSNEDDDDSDDDSCDDSDEDLDDRLGPIVSFDPITFDPDTWRLVIDTLAAGKVTFVVTEDTEIEYDSSGSGSGWEGDVSDLKLGAVVVEVDFEDDGTLEEIELARTETD